MTRSCGSNNHDKHLKYKEIDININQTIITLQQIMRGVCAVKRVSAN